MVELKVPIIANIPSFHDATKTPIITRIPDIGLLAKTTWPVP
jgi:hypothetical protein